MVHIFNRKLLYSTYDITMQTKLREALAREGIDYYLNPVMMTLEKIRVWQNISFM